MTSKVVSYVIDELLTHVSHPKYQQPVHWKGPGDVTFWDKPAVLHRAITGDYSGKYRRDMRRIFTFDSTPWSYGGNNIATSKQIGLR